MTGRAAKRAASIIRERLAANDLTFLHGRSSAVPSLEEAVGQYLAERLAFQTIDPFTKDNYERTLRKHVFPVLGSVGVTAIQREDLKAIFERLLAAKASKSLCRNILAPIKQTYEWLIDDRGLGASESSRPAWQVLARDDRQKEAGRAPHPAGPSRFSEGRPDTAALLLSLSHRAACRPPAERVFRAPVDRL